VRGPYQVCTQFLDNLHVAASNGIRHGINQVAVILTAVHAMEVDEFTVGATLVSRTIMAFAPCRRGFRHNES
jgi:hypothetical protein